MQEPPKDPSADFDHLINLYYKAWFRFHPEVAVDCGQDQVAGELTPFSNSQMGALLTLHEELLGALEEVDYQQLDVDRKLDFDILIGQVYLERQSMLKFDWRFRDPQIYLPFNAINQLLQRPITDFGQSLLARLNVVPDYLGRAKEQIRQNPETIPYPWLEQTISSAHSGDIFMRALDTHPKVIDVISKGPAMVSVIDAARKAIRDFARFLETEIGSLAKGETACGEHRFNNLLRLQHGLDIDHQQLYKFGLQLVEQTYVDLKQQCMELAGHEDISVLNERIGSDHPSSESLVSVYKESMQDAKRFISKANLVSMPGNETLEVVETPEFLRHRIPYAAYLPPMVNDMTQKGYYYVTPADDHESLVAHNFLSIKHTCTHEAYPGHHLQFVTANTNPVSRSWPRLINTSSTLYEGWALYCEQLMVDHNFLDQPLNKFIVLKDRLWRALRVVIDVDLHVNNVSHAQAARKLCDRLGFSQGQAIADVAWYTHAPTTPMGYAVGWSMINALREDLQLSNSFKIKEFHDKLLGCGSIALSAVIKRQFGDKAFNNVMCKLID